MARVETGRGAEVGEQMGRGQAPQGSAASDFRTDFALYYYGSEQREHGLTFQQDHSGC